MNIFRFIERYGLQRPDRGPSVIETHEFYSRVMPLAREIETLNDRVHNLGDLIIRAAQLGISTAKLEAERDRLVEEGNVLGAQLLDMIDPGVPLREVDYSRDIDEDELVIEEAWAALGKLKKGL